MLKLPEPIPFTMINDSFFTLETPFQGSLTIQIIPLPIATTGCQQQQCEDESTFYFADQDWLFDFFKARLQYPQTVYGNFYHKPQTAEVDWYQSRLATAFALESLKDKEEALLEIWYELEGDSAVIGRWTLDEKMHVTERGLAMNKAITLLMPGERLEGFIGG